MKTLEEQIALGFRAASAYNAYFKEFFAAELGELRDAIIETGDIEEVMVLKRKIEALKYIEERLRADIDTGRMAEVSLNER